MANRSIADSPLPISIDAWLDSPGSAIETQRLVDALYAARDLAQITAEYFGKPIPDIHRQRCALAAKILLKKWGSDE